MGGRSGRTGCAIGWVGQEGKDWGGQEGEDCGGHEGETVCVCDMRGRLCVRGERRGGLCVGVKGGRTVWTARVGQYGGPYVRQEGADSVCGTGRAGSRGRTKCGRGYGTDRDVV